MVRVRIRWEDFSVLVESDAEPHPDLLDELTTRAKRLFLETTASLPEAEG